MADKMRLCLLNYDIHQKRFPNPAARFRRFGVYLTESVCVFIKDNEPWEILNAMTEAGVTWHLHPFAYSATQGILECAAAYMRRQLRLQLESEGESLARYDAALEEIETDDTLSGETILAARAKHQKDQLGAIRRTRKLVEDLEHAASMFGIDVDNMVPEINTTRSRLGGLQTLNGQRATFYVELAAEAKRRRLDVETSGENAMPAPILLDRLEEEGVNVDAARAAFQEDEEGVESRGGQTTSSTQGRRVGTVLADNPPRRVEQGTQPPQVYTVHTRSGIMRRESRFTDREAARVLRHREGDMAASLAHRVLRGRTISPMQRAWLHILAVEEWEAFQSQNATQPAPVAAVAPANPIPTPTPEVVSPPAPVKKPDNGAVVVDSSKCVWNHEAKTLTIEASVLELYYTPGYIQVRSHKTGNLEAFINPQEIRGGTEDQDGEDNEVIAWVYSGPKGVKLHILND